MKVVSGGQTGVDRAALDEALRWGFEIGGYCPRGRRAEDGVIPDRYPLQEMVSEAYDVRTRHNVLRSDATLVLTCGEITPGSKLTVRMAEDADKLLAVIDVCSPWSVDNVIDVAEDAARRGVHVLNVAGPRASKRPLAYDQSRRFLAALFKELGYERRKQS